MRRATSRSEDAKNLSADSLRNSRPDVPAPGPARPGVRDLPPLPARRGDDGAAVPARQRLREAATDSEGVQRLQLHRGPRSELPRPARASRALEGAAADARRGARTAATTAVAIDALRRSSRRSPSDPDLAYPAPRHARATRALGRYEIERELGKGAMGTVYLGRDPKINRVVAIKAIPLARGIRGGRSAGSARALLPRGRNGRAT